MVKREIITDQFLWAATSTQDFAGLFYIDSALANCSDKSTIDLFPVKDLAGVEGHREIEIRGGDLSQFHQRFYSHKLPRENDEKRSSARTSTTRSGFVLGHFVLDRKSTRLNSSH